MMAVAAAVVFSAAAGVAIATIVAIVGPQWRRILHVAAGGSAMQPADKRQHWREVHLAADRRPPLRGHAARR